MSLKIKRIIENRSVQILMQAILSPLKDLSVGMEALARGIDLDTGEVIGAGVLIEEARDRGLLIDLEKLLIEKAIESYAPFYKIKSELLLFVNVDAELLEYCINHDFIIDKMDELNIPYGNIVFDLNGIDFSTRDLAKNFISKYRNLGFAICIDDLGRDYSNLDKIIMMNPDIIKINASRLNSLADGDYKKNVIGFLNHIAQKMGMVVVAKGIEDKASWIQAVKNGAQFIQGYYVAKPMEISPNDLNQWMDDLYDKIQIEDYLDQDHIEQDRVIMGKLARMTERLGKEITPEILSEFETHQMDYFDRYPMIETIWFVDENGIQTGPAYNNSDRYKIRHGSIFHTYKAGSDFSKSDIYRQIWDTILTVWLTEPFVSMMTNNVCIGASSYVANSKYIVCMNINYEAFLKRKQKIK
jgi:EAL domain-containing protein (putative c-di-GMP-specific phosphodiesterase class I)